MRALRPLTSHSPDRGSGGRPCDSERQAGSREASYAQNEPGRFASAKRRQLSQTSNVRESPGTKYGGASSARDGASTGAGRAAGAPSSFGATAEPRTRRKYGCANASFADARLERS